MQQPVLTIACSELSIKTLAFPANIAGHKLVTRRVSSPADLINCNVCAVLIDETLLTTFSLSQWHSPAYTLLVPFAVSHNEALDNILIIADNMTEKLLHNSINFSYQHQLLQTTTAGLHKSLQLQSNDMEKLVDIGIAISAEKNLAELLSKILTEGQRLVGCDAASLFLLDKSDENNPCLIFKLTQNQSLDPPFKEKSIPLTASSIVGHVALTGEVLNIHDAYNISNTESYQFNQSFDKTMNYRTVSLVAIPMIDQRKNIVGVLEFINHKKNPEALLTDPATIEAKVDDFSERNVALLRALSSQAAVAVENRQLLDDVNHLFDGFVQASVFAIEQRDPSTSGHSFRVADLCGELAHEVNRSDLQLADVHFDNNQLRELHFAALLHDFGKVGVRENVLTKAKKLSVNVIENVHYRIALEKERLKNKALSEILTLIDTEGSISAKSRQNVECEMLAACQKLNQFLTTILTSNEPTVLPEGDFSVLQEICNYKVHDCHGHSVNLLSDVEFESLSIMMGSLTMGEREEIESHVVHTENFLRLIPWTSELSRIPEIAGAHHEKLNGGGYPNGLSASKISYQSRIMTICDIYDALTASDRPYKKAITTEKAIRILDYEARAGFLDTDLVAMFSTTQCYKIIEAKHYPSGASSSCNTYHHHVCDYGVGNNKH